MSFLDHIARCNNADLSQFEPWFVGDDARRLPPSRLRCRPSPCGPICSAIATAAWHLDADARHARPSARPRCAPSCSSLRERGLFRGLWREEAYTVSAQFNASAPARDGARGGAVVRRARLRAAHDGLCPKKRTGCTSGCRAAPTTSRPSPASSTTPSRAASRPDIGLLENLIKECAEEASIPRDLAEQAKAVGFIAYWNQSGRQLKPDIMTCFDLELPDDFTPECTTTARCIRSSCGRSSACSRRCATPPSSSTTAIWC